eukprot:TRINITY_DN1815_c0_g1_i2.p1 TRINITY_DN1815_c0_g1~~TRINITY_DN1815_c0_g1_i2.p1  ORF type:complete len:1581 (+),score=389.81 TRINITY_DN1815_c0_g1_i2:120-4862(+)
MLDSDQRSHRPTDDASSPSLPSPAWGPAMKQRTQVELDALGQLRSEVQRTLVQPWSSRVPAKARRGPTGWRSSLAAPNAGNGWQLPQRLGSARASPGAVVVPALPGRPLPCFSADAGSPLLDVSLDAAAGSRSPSRSGGLLRQCSEGSGSVSPFRGRGVSPAPERHDFYEVPRSRSALGQAASMRCPSSMGEAKRAASVQGHAVCSPSRGGRCDSSLSTAAPSPAPGHSGALQELSRLHEINRALREENSRLLKENARLMTTESVGECARLRELNASLVASNERLSSLLVGQDTELTCCEATGSSEVVAPPARCCAGRASSSSSVAAAAATTTQLARLSVGKASRPALDDEAELAALAAERERTVAEQEAFNQTLSPRYFLMGMEHSVLATGAAMGRAEAKKREQDQNRRDHNRPSRGKMAQFESFIPKAMMRCIRRGIVNFEQWKVLLDHPTKSSYNPVISNFPAAVVFADASGFTRLTESLGAEKIASTLNGFFGPILKLVDKYGGDIIKFSGDALTIVWPAADPAPPAAKPRTGARGTLRGSLEENMRVLENDPEAKASCVAAMVAASMFCVKVQETIHTFNKTPLPDLDLTLHIGVGFGDISLLQLGALMGRWEYCIAGTPLDQIAIAEPLASPGETVLSPEATALLSGTGFVLEEVNDGVDLHKGFVRLLRFQPTPGTTPPWQPRPYVATEEDGEEAEKDDPFAPPMLNWWPGITEDNEKVDWELSRRFVPTAVALRLESSPTAESVTYPEEMRRMSVIFLSILDLEVCTTAAQLLMRLMQRSVYALEGSVNKFLVDDKGVLLLVAFGLPPLIHFTDDPVRAVLCAMRLNDTIQDEKLRGKVGVATGKCWCGVVGSPVRREYTVLGDVVNLAARLMGKAPMNGVLVDAPTKEVASSVLDFRDGGLLSLKGKSQPVQSFMLNGTKKGFSDYRKVSGLRIWQEWPARTQLLKVLNRHKRQSGVIFITGPGGVGKTPLVEEATAWSAAQGWATLCGHNMDPSGVFALPRLVLQGAFRELVAAAAKEPFWRQKARELLVESLGDKSQMKEKMEEIFSHQDLGPPSHAELYWMLIAMLRKSNGGENSALEPWVPILTLVITQLSFAPKNVEAMLERNDQHVKDNRVASLCSSILDGFASGQCDCNHSGGTTMILHLRRSSSFFYARDPHEATTIHAMAELCMRRRAANPDGEANPLVLVIVSRESTLNDSRVRDMAQMCDAVVEVDDLNRHDTECFLQCLLGPQALAEEQQNSSQGASGNHGSLKVDPDKDPRHTSKENTKKDEKPQSPQKSARVGLAFDGVTEDSGAELLTQYVFEMTGGNPLGIEDLVQELKRTGMLCAGDNGLVLAKNFETVSELQKAVTLPESIISMAFSVFEHLNPQEQQILKVASTFDGAFMLRELNAAVSQLSLDDLLNTCNRLSAFGMRVFRKKALVQEGKKQGDSAAYSQFKYFFYSGLLRHVASTLVLEQQRVEVRRKSMALHTGLHAGGLANFLSAERLAQEVAEGGGDEDDGDEEESDEEESEEEEAEEDEAVAPDEEPPQSGQAPAHSEKAPAALKRKSKKKSIAGDIPKVKKHVGF